MGLESYGLRGFRCFWILTELRCLAVFFYEIVRVYLVFSIFGDFFCVVFRGSVFVLFLIIS